MMTSIHVNLRRVVDNSYTIRLGITLEEAGKELRSIYPHSVKFVVTDSNVGKRYAKRLLRAIGPSSSHVIVVPAGERSKSRKTKEVLENKIISLGAERGSVIIALGGGMIGDLAGFVAATLLRGVPFVQIPTSLLAQVDSSVGGKVGVDHSAGKNLVGAFYQPGAVYIDPSTLRSLPEMEFANGMAEVIKYAAIADRRLFTFLEENSTRLRARNMTALHFMLKRCCQLKASVVEHDERERGLRRILNFGHTIGHAVESLSRYRIPHGSAVAIGMIAEARISVRLGMLTPHALDRFERLVEAYHLPTSLPASFSIGSIVEATAHDKKAREGKVFYTLLERLGKARVGVPLAPTRARTLLRT